LASSIAQLPAADIDWLIGLPAFADREDAFYCHGSPRSDVDSFAPEPRDDDERLLAGVKERQVVFGHSHAQFRRLGPNDTDLVNPLDLAADGQMDRVDREAAVRAVEGHLRVGLQLRGRVPRLREAVRERHREARRMCSGDQLLGACLAARLLEPGRERDLLVLDRVTRLEIELTLTALEIASPGRLRLALNRHSQP